MKEEKIFRDQSEVHRTYMVIYGTLGICLLGYAAMTVRYIYHMHQIPWLDVITELLLLLFLGSTAMARSTYELHEKELVIISSSLFRTRKLAIPYSAIDGAFHFKVEPIKTIAYRHTYRMYGSMDKREIWSLVYNMPNTDKVSRVLMKASEAFWEEFEKRLPGRIRVSQEAVLKHAYYHISGADLKKNRNRAKRQLPQRPRKKNHCRMQKPSRSRRQPLQNRQSPRKPYRKRRPLPQNLPLLKRRPPGRKKTISK